MQLKKCIKFDSNLVYLSAYVNMDFIYLKTKQFNHRNGLIVFLTTCFVLK